MLENDDELENINPILPDDEDAQIIDLDETPVTADSEVEQPAEMSFDDIFADIPPMPEDYDVSPEVSLQSEVYEEKVDTVPPNQSFNEPVAEDTVTVQPVKFASFEYTASSPERR